MSEELVAEAIMGLLIAGHDDVTSTITLIFEYFAELPHIYDAISKGNFFQGGVHLWQEMKGFNQGKRLMVTPWVTADPKILFNISGVPLLSLM